MPTKNNYTPTLENLRKTFLLTLFFCLISGMTFCVPDDTTVTATYIQEPPDKQTNPTAEQLKQEVEAVVQRAEQRTSNKPSYVYYDVPLSDDLQEYTQTLCHSMGVYYPLVIAIMTEESGFDPSSISPPNRNGTTDWGLMQINCGNHEWLSEELGITDFLDPWQSIMAGVYMLSLYSFLENHHDILLCYNNGYKGTKELWAQGIYTLPYCEVILTTMERLEVRDDGSS